ncbi:HNH endonuclease [Bacillus sp. 71mf]|uniref:HNH endonuclease n=1 Tax=Bacillus sp. 71mf TaxID=1761757 RepID=UPI00244EF476|nr:MULTISPECIES: HNH endonuclease [unclassified Bacillus (in: firmicutes)]
MQFKECTQMLKKAIEKGEILKEIFTPKQLKEIKIGLPRISDLTWHHHQVPGKMQLVIKKKHSLSHLGGNKLWGGDIR